jgi:hypothetical protein
VSIEDRGGKSLDGLESSIAEAIFDGIIGVVGNSLYEGVFLLISCGAEGIRECEDGGKGGDLSDF